MMRKLIDTFNRHRTVDNARKLLAYLDKHPMAICMAFDDDITIIGYARQMVDGQ